MRLRSGLATICLAWGCAHTSGVSTPPPECLARRGAVRTLTDPEAAGVDLTPEASSVEALVALDAPSSQGGAGRAPAERRTYGVTAWLMQEHGTKDGEITLVLRGDSGATMLARLPAPVCLEGSPVADSVASARTTLAYLLGSVEGTHKSQVRLRVNGVVHFVAERSEADAPNGLELDPVLAIETR